MTLARVEKRIQSDAIQGVSPAATPASEHADLLAEFSSLVEKIAGQVQTSQGNPDFSLPLEAPKAKKTPQRAREDAPQQDAPEATSSTAQGQVESRAEEVTDQEAEPEHDLDSDSEATQSDEQASEKEQVVPTDTNAEVALDGSQTQVQVATAAAATAASSEQLKSEATKGADLVTAEANENLQAEVDSAPTQEATGTAVPQVPAERAAPKAEHAKAKVAQSVPEAVATQASDTQKESTQSAKIASPEDNALQGGEQLVAESTARALKNLLVPQQTSQATTPASFKPRIEVLDRDAMLSALIVKPIIDQQLRGADAAKAVPMNNQVQGIDAAGLKSTASRSTSNDTGARSARNLARVNSDRLLEKVEGALKEVARSKDGSSLSFRLDPPQLGSVRVDVTLRDGGLHARVIPENPQVAQLMKERAHELQNNLRSLGLNVETVSVSVGGESFSDTMGADQSPLSQENGSRGDRGGGREGQSGAAMGAWAESAVKATEDHWVA